MSHESLYSHDSFMHPCREVASATPLKIGLYIAFNSINTMYRLSKNINLVVACQRRDWGIAMNGGIPWRAPTDMRHFKRVTSETKDASLRNAVVMGRKTFDTIGKPLPNRINYVLTRNRGLLDSDSPNLHYVPGLDEALHRSTNNQNVERVFVIGGAEVYRETLRKFYRWIDTTFLTFVETDYECDQFLDKDLVVDNHHYTGDGVQKVEENGTVLTFHEFRGRNRGEEEYLDLMHRILDNGVIRSNRTGVNTISVFGERMEFDISQSIPFLTTKRLAWKTMLRELLWFISGDTNNETLQAKNVHIWDGNSTREYLDSIGLTDREEGDLGPVYGHNWRHFGAEYVDCHTDYAGQGVDQLAEVIRLVKETPDSRRIIMSAWNPKAQPEMALPPCFTAGTLVLTARGYIPIEDVHKEDLLVSHTGTLRGINQIHITDYTGPLYHIKTEFHPHLINTTPEHPFYVRHTMNDDPEWVKAKNLTEHDYIGFPINTNTIIPSFEYEQTVNQYSTKKITISLDNPEYWFIMGYYLGDGWLDWSENKKHRFYFVFNDKDMDIVYPRIKNILKLSEVKTTSTGCRKFEGRKLDWWNILKDFGHLAHNKRIPEWVHDTPTEFIESFIEGYIAADGCKTKVRKLINATTVSPHIAFGLQRLYAKLGRVISVRYQHKPNTCIIQGRIVNQRNLYHIDKSINNSNRIHTQIKDNYVWFSIKNISRTETTELVYNFDVEEDHTYIVENLAVHNCHIMAQWYVRDGKYLDCQMYQRSCDVALGVPFNIASYSVLTYMIAHVTGLQPGRYIQVLGDAHIYSNHLDAVKEQLDRIPYQFPRLRFARQVTDIDDFGEGDFIVDDYQCHPTIKMDMAV